MSFFKSVFKVLTGAGSKLLDPLGIWGDNGKAADAAERRHKEAISQAELARNDAKNQAELTRKQQEQHELSLKSIAENAKKLSDANASRNDQSTTNVVAGGVAGISASTLKKKKAVTSMSSSLGINI